MPRLKYDWAAIDPLLTALPRWLSAGDLQRLSRQTGCPAAYLSHRLRELRAQGRVVAQFSGWGWRTEEEVATLAARGVSVAGIATRVERTPEAVADLLARQAKQEKI